MSYRVLHLGKNNPKNQDNIDGHPAGKKPSREGPVSTSSTHRFNIGQYCVLATEKAYIKQSVTSRLRNSLSVQHWQGHTWSALSSSGLLRAKQTRSYWKQPKKELQSQQLSHKERLRELGLFSLVNRSILSGYSHQCT